VGDQRVRERFDALWSVQEGLREPQDLLLQAKALVLCALPYKRLPDARITRKARIGKTTFLSVTFAAVGEGAVLPFGADRALFGWIQTRAYRDGFIAFETLKEFLTAFGLNDSGANYRLFKQRVDRLTHFAVSIETSTDDEEALLNITPVRSAYFPKSSRAARRKISIEDAGQLLLIPEKYGFRLDPMFWEYLKANPVPLPLSLMRLFHNKPKGWDFAQFVLYRCYAARTKSVVPWTAFSEQLGSRDTNQRRLRATLAGFLRQMKVVYPNLSAEFLPGYEGLAVAPWAPPPRERQ
jgi:hypothetical protein